MFANTVDRYGSVAKSLHWLTALLILPAIPLGLVANGMAITPDSLPLKAQLFSIHKTLGVAAFFVALARIVWALTQTKPALLNAEKRVESFLAETVHWLLYASLVIVPLSGWLHHAATEGFAPIWWPFGQSLPFVPKSEALAGFFSAWHYIFTKVLGISLVLHIAGALKHHVIDKDATLRRMWFGRADLPALSAHATPMAPILAAAAIYAGAFGLASVQGLAAPHESAPAVASVTAPATGGDWQVEDGTLSIVVTQFGSEVTGNFADWSAEIAFDEAAEGEKGAVTVTIGIGSLTLGTVTNDALGAAFFNAEAFPTATYTGPITETDTGYGVDGTLTLKGTEAAVPLTFTLEIDGDTAQMEGTATLDRRTFNIGEGYDDEATVAFGVDVSVALTATRVAAE